MYLSSEQAKGLEMVAPIFTGLDSFHHPRNAFNWMKRHSAQKSDLAVLFGVNHGQVKEADKPLS